jgi:phytanoyl-CoA hydroxylase
MNSSEIARVFRERGWLALEGFLKPAQIEEIERELGRYIREGAPEKIAGHVVFEAGAERKIRNIFHLHKHNEFFASLAEAPEFVEMARAIFDDEPVLMSVELFAKPAHVGSEVPYHQDNAYFNLTPDHALTCWLALADATVENGCVRYIEGSHKFGNLPHRPSGVKGNSMVLGEVPRNAGSEVCGVVRRGGVLVHHCNTIHRSAPNRSDKDRPGLLFVYKAARCQIDEPRAAKYREAATAT